MPTGRQPPVRAGRIGRARRPPIGRLHHRVAVELVVARRLEGAFVDAAAQIGQDAQAQIAVLQHQQAIRLRRRVAGWTHHKPPGRAPAPGSRYARISRGALESSIGISSQGDLGHAIARCRSRGRRRHSHCAGRCGGRCSGSWRRTGRSGWHRRRDISWCQRQGWHGRIGWHDCRRWCSRDAQHGCGKWRVVSVGKGEADTTGKAGDLSDLSQRRRRFRGSRCRHAGCQRKGDQQQEKNPLIHKQSGP